MSTWYASYVPSWVNRWWVPPPSPTNPYNNIRPPNIYSPTSNDAILGVRKVDLCLKENHTDHHTAYFKVSNEALIVRRGEPFRIRIYFNRPYSPTRDAISFIFSVADEKKPSPGHGTLIAIAPKDAIDYLGDIFEWGAGIESQDDDTITVLIKPAATCPVTEWKFDIDTKLYGDGSQSFSIPFPIYILFNPWCRDDQVYMENYEGRKEYVMNDTTVIWRGCYKEPLATAWQLGQFERDILECSVKLLGTVGRIPAAYRGDPVRVARALSAAVNSVNDDGVLFGQWSDDFSDGVAPTKWIGSIEILQQFYKTQKPVKFGQCWNFSGVLATIARCLGIPTRIVTCYLAAHDAQGSLTIDIFVDATNRTMNAESGDSIWNFHVWNELWMERPDLGIGPHNGTYGGWQVVDATPQEPSDNIYRCGPTSVISVKNGEILRPFDTGFVFSEVNADKVYWRYNGPSQPLKLIRIDTLSIGHFISTKAIKSSEREDITDSYKFAEKTSEERNVMLKALKQSQHTFSRYYLNESFNEVQFDMQLNDDIKIGEQFSVVVVVTNRSPERVHVAKLQLNCDSVLHTGVIYGPVKSRDFEVELQPATSEFVRMEVTFEEYFNKLTSQGFFNISCSGLVEGTDYEYYAQDDFNVRKPEIKISFQGKVVSGQEVDVIVRLTNPLPTPLRKGMFYIGGPGIEKSLRFKIAEIPVGGTGASTFKYVPPYAGRATMVAKFISKELNDINGHLFYEVEPRPEDVISNGFSNGGAPIRRRTDVIP